MASRLLAVFSSKLLGDSRMEEHIGIREWKSILSPTLLHMVWIDRDRRSPAIFRKAKMSLLRAFPLRCRSVSAAVAGPVGAVERWGGAFGGQLSTASIGLWAPEDADAMGHGRCRDLRWCLRLGVPLPHQVKENLESDSPASEATEKGPIGGVRFELFTSSIPPD